MAAAAEDWFSMTYISSWRRSCQVSFNDWHYNTLAIRGHQRLMLLNRRTHLFLATCHSLRRLFPIDDCRSRRRRDSIDSPRLGPRRRMLR